MLQKYVEKLEEAFESMERGNERENNASDSSTIVDEDVLEGKRYGSSTGESRNSI